jgi:Fe-S cluster biosynthesis and repair protein YggX
MVRELLASRYNRSRLSREAASARFSSYGQELALRYPEISKKAWQIQLNKLTSLAALSESSRALREEFIEFASSKEAETRARSI